MKNFSFAMIATLIVLGMVGCGNKATDGDPAPTASTKSAPVPSTPATGAPATGAPAANAPIAQTPSGKAASDAADGAGK